MITHLLIGTTAINRIEMYNDVIPAWNTFLSKLAEIVWFINIDEIELLDDIYEATKENLLSIISKKTLLLPTKKPGLFESFCLPL
jgi:hypothetical protein